MNTPLGIKILLEALFSQIEMPAPMHVNGLAAVVSEKSEAS
jgi:hypothetical protein